jgi:hypothetical protein
VRLWGSAGRSGKTMVPRGRRHRIHEQCSSSAPKSDVLSTVAFSSLSLNRGDNVFLVRFSTTLVDASHPSHFEHSSASSNLQPNSRCDRSKRRKPSHRTERERCVACRARCAYAAAIRSRGGLRVRPNQPLLVGLPDGKRTVPIVNPIRWQLIENRAVLLLDV